MRRMRKLATGLLLSWAASLQATSYSVIELPPLGGNALVPTGAYDISETGDCWVAGSSGSGTGRRAVRWRITPTGAWAPTNLGLLSPYTWSVGYGVNDFGDVVGTAGGVQAFVWSPLQSPALQPIPKPAGAPSTARCTVAYSINETGHVVGIYKAPPVQALWAFRWKSQAGTTLYPSPYSHTSIGSTANDVNYFGVFVGMVEMVEPPASGTSGDGFYQAFRWEPENMTSAPLGAFPDPEGRPGTSVAYGINDLKEIVGESDGIAFLWTRLDGMVPIAVGVAKGINNDGVVVGYNSQNAWVKWPNSSVVQDLNTLIPPNSGWTLLEAHGINNWGFIVGIGRKNVPGDGLSGNEDGTVPVLRGFVLVPQ